MTQCVIVCDRMSLRKICVVGECYRIVTVGKGRIK